MAGRKYYGSGELYEYDLFSSTVCAKRPDEAELFTEKFIVKPRQQKIRGVGMMGEFDVFGNVILLTPKIHADRIFKQAPAEVNLDEKWAAERVACRTMPA
jgi:urease accessory protein